VRCLAAALTLVLPPLALAHPVEVRLWDDADVITGTITKNDAQRVTLTIAEAKTETLPWTRIASITPPPTAQLASRLAAGQDAWRAAQRLERSDALGAGPLLESHADKYLGKRGEVSLAIAAGLARCRLDQFDRPGALAPWIAAIYAAGPAPGGGDLPAWLGADPATGLCPDLIPIWTDAEASDLLDLEQHPRPLAAPDSRAQRLLELYLLAARWHTPDAAERAAVRARFDEIAAAHTDPDPAIDFVTEIVGATIADDATRETMRARLRTRLDRSPDPWEALWAHLAIGCSLAGEPDDASRRRGATELLAAALTDAAVSPLLAGKALAWAADAAGMVGDDPAAAAFRDELTRRYPGHPDAAGPHGKDTALP